MARLGFKHTTQVQTRDKYTKCDFELGMTLDGKELPNAAVLGAALEDAVKLIQDRITESYQVVPPRAEVPATATVIPANEVQPATVMQPVPVAAQQVPQPVRSVPTIGEQIADDLSTPLTSGGLGFPPGYSQQ